MVDPAATTQALKPYDRAWRLARRAYATVVVCIFGVLLWRLPGSWQELSALARPTGAMVFVACWVAMVVVLGLLWRASLRALAGPRLDLRTVIEVQSAAWAGRYLPGKVGLLAGKLTLAGREGLDARLLTGSVMFEQFAFVAAGCVLASLLVDPAALAEALAPGMEVAAFERAFRVAGIGGAVIAGTVAIVAGLRIAGRGSAVALCGVLALHLIPHLLAGLGLYVLLANELVLAPGFARATGAMAAANIAGVLAIFAPAGLGVREAVLVGVLAQAGGVSSMVALAALLRILATIGDVLVVATGLIAGVGRRR